MKQLPHPTVEKLRRHWQDGWNDADVDTIVEPFADDIVFTSPGVSMMTGDPERTAITGRSALREYVASALTTTSAVRYELDATHVGTDSIVLVYRCVLPNGREKPGADLMRVDEDGRIVEWRCHY